MMEKYRRKKGYDVFESVGKASGITGQMLLGLFENVNKWK